jgi:uncharacterized HAD superfamily protein
MKKLMLDMDGVIANFHKGFAEFLNKEYGCTLDPNISPSKYSFEDWGGGVERVNIKDATNKWMMDYGFNTLMPFEGAEKFVKGLDSIVDLYIVTARVGKGEWKNQVLPEHIVKKAKLDTISWLQRHNMPTEKLFFIKDKIPFCKDNGISIVIEDKLETALNASKEGLHTILINTNYNSSIADRFKIYRVENLDEALEWVKKLIKI